MYATITTNPCPLCGETSELTVKPEDWNAWANGAFVQEVWPDKSAEWRELVKTGTHGRCWDILWAEDDDDE